MLPELVAPPEDFAQRARPSLPTSALPGEAARALCALVADEVEYLPGATDVHTTAGRRGSSARGVCQDMVHLVIGGLRSIGIPARYVSGYLHPSPDPVIGETVVGDSHAWVEWWDDGWHAFDLTNAVEPDDRYVVVATGRDYDDVKPISGIYSGAATSEMTVEVEVTRLGLTPPSACHTGPADGLAGRPRRSYLSETGDTSPRKVRAPQGKVVGNTHPG